MTKDLFFNIWHNEFGFGWVLFVIVLSIITILALIFVIGITKAKKKNLHINIKYFL